MTSNQAEQSIIELRTERLLLRQWTNNDFEPFYRMNSDKAVMEFFPKCLSREQSDQAADRIQSFISKHGWGFWAVELIGQEKFIGFVGLNIPTAALPFSPCVEIGWRLAKSYWGKGYATEAARASLNCAFSALNLDEVVSFTPVINRRSQAVMKKTGMADTTDNFHHPVIERSHSLSEHVLYKITRERKFSD